ncbi:MAG: hypothetical protein PHO54_06115 [Candidatus Peribacteraceae bacterium]|nr:hypothetical protein [Candidatus Peribacteraceae bacterium]
MKDHTSPAIGREPVPRAIGQTLATLQHLADLAVDWGFKKIKKAGEMPIAKNEERKPLGFVKKVSFPVLKFLGTMGESYFDWYEKLKAGKRKER